jgi:F0F1-type ATP synthase assembly protein I
MTRDPRGGKPGRTAPGAADVAGIGLQFALVVMAGLLAGQWLDRRLGSGPWLMLAGMLLGFAATLHSAIRRLSPPKRGDGEER